MPSEMKKEKGSLNHMKCSNCGANLEMDHSRMLKFCPYCGQQVELHEEAPQNVTALFSDIAKSLLSQRAEQKRFDRDHAAEISEQKRRDKAEEQKRDMKIMGMLMGGVTAMAVIGMIVSRVFIQ